jgi:hypothetical protein
MTKPFVALRLALVAVGLTIAAPSFASVVIPLCGGEKDADDSKNKSENKKEKEPPKKPTNPA